MQSFIHEKNVNNFCPCFIWSDHCYRNILVCCFSIVLFLLHFSLRFFVGSSSVLCLCPPSSLCQRIVHFVLHSVSLTSGFFFVCLFSHRLSWYKCITIDFSISLTFWPFHTCIPLRCDLRTTLILTTLLTIQYNNQIPIDYGMARKSLSDIYTCCMFPHNVTASCYIVRMGSNVQMQLDVWAAVSFLLFFFSRIYRLISQYSVRMRRRRRQRYKKKVTSTTRHSTSTTKQNIRRQRKKGKFFFGFLSSLLFKQTQWSVQEATEHRTPDPKKKNARKQ